MHASIPTLTLVESIIHIVALVKDLAQRVSTTIRTHLPIESATFMLAVNFHLSSTRYLLASLVIITRLVLTLPVQRRGTNHEMHF
jgi:hypothetical protein